MVKAILTRKDEEDALKNELYESSMNPALRKRSIGSDMAGAPANPAFRGQRWAEQ
jgi:hypothetical protein